QILHQCHAIKSNAVLYQHIPIIEQRLCYTTVFVVWKVAGPRGNEAICKANMGKTAVQPSDKKIEAINKLILVCFYKATEFLQTFFAVNTCYIVIQHDEMLVIRLLQYPLARLTQSALKMFRQYYKLELSIFFRGCSVRFKLIMPNHDPYTML